MIQIIDWANDKSNYPTIGGGLLAAIIGNILWVFPFLKASPVWGTIGALFVTAISTLVVFIVTGLCKRHEKNLLNYVENKVFFLNRKNKRNGKKKNSKNAA